MIDRTPYTYLIGWTSINKWYYGRRTAKNCHPNEFWIKYFTSSFSVKEYILKYGNPDVIEIRKIFDSIEDCKRWESRVLSHYKVETNDMWINQRSTDDKWDTTGKYNGGNTGVPHTEETKRKMRKPKKPHIRQKRSIESLRKNKSIGIWHTPYGDFSYTTDAAKAANCSNVYIYKKCKLNPDTCWFKEPTSI